MDKLLHQSIVDQLGLEALSPDKQAEILERIGRLIFQGVLIRVLEGMDGRQKDRFEEFLSGDQPDSQAMFDYLEKTVPHFNEVIEQEIVKFKRESLDLLAGLI